jgi:putative Mg2+ transporter-C (MgtC) family protein
VDLVQRLHEFIGGGELDVMWSVLLAMLFGGLIGFERELKARPAGFRTHMLVAGAAAFLVGATRLWAQAELTAASGPSGGPDLIRMDPLRAVEAVVAGVGFIGAGCIFAGRNGDTVHGITTASSLLMVAVIGLVVGLGFGLLALSVTLATLAVLAALRRIERGPLKRLTKERSGGEANETDGGRSVSALEERS